MCSECDGTGLITETRWDDKFLRRCDHCDGANLDAAFRELRQMTKRHPASLWDEHYRELASKIHAIGRQFFYVRADE
jgi:hypothetical protein